MTIEDIKKKIDRTSSSGCSLWQGSVNNDGYPVVYYQGNTRYVNRVAWEHAYKRSIPSGMALVRTCGNILCVNPKHMDLVAKDKPIAEHRYHRLREQSSTYHAPATPLHETFTALHGM